MKTIFVTLFAIAFPAIIILIIWKLLFGLRSSLIRNMLIALTIIIAVILESVFILSGKIPSKADMIFSNTIALIEAEAEAHQPGITTQVLDKEELSSLLAERKKIDKHLDSNKELNFIVRHTAANAFLGNIENLCGNIEHHIANFEEKQIPFTLSNIFEYSLEEIKEPVKKVTKVFEIIIMTLSAIFICLVVFLWISIKKGWLEDGVRTANSEIVKS